MSETGGGCVYDGVPLEGVSVRIEDPDEAGVGRIVLAGPVLAEGIFLIYIKSALSDGFFSKSLFPTPTIIFISLEP